MANQVGIRVILDVLCAKFPEDRGKKAEGRGLHFTIDGVHLNDRGAGLIAELLLQKIEDFMGRDSRGE